MSTLAIGIVVFVAIALLVALFTVVKLVIGLVKSSFTQSYDSDLDMFDARIDAYDLEQEISKLIQKMDKAVISGQTELARGYAQTVNELLDGGVK
jgi:hypothetical protein